MRVCIVKCQVHAETYVDPSELEEQIATLDFQLREMEHEGRSLEESIRSSKHNRLFADVLLYRYSRSSSFVVIKAFYFETTRLSCACY